MADNKMAIEAARSYLVGKRPNRLYRYGNLIVCFYAQGKRVTDNVAAFDASGKRVRFDILHTPSFFSTAEEIGTEGG